MFFVFDANIWIAQQGLTSTLGSATKLYIKHKGGSIVLPQVVRLEVERHLESDMNEWIESISKNHRKLLSVFGELKEIVLPDEKKVRAHVEGFFTNVGLELREIPFDLESAWASFMKTIDKVPPSHKQQQFKDGVIWENCLKLLDEGDVCWVTEDKAFFKNEKIEQGLAENLLEEIREKPHQLKLYQKLTDLLDEFKYSFQVDDDLLISQFTENSSESTRRFLTERGFELGEVIGFKKRLFATENLDRLYVEFDISFECNDTTGQNRTGTFETSGDGSYSISTGQFEKLKQLGSKLTFQDVDGEVKVNRHVFLGGTISLGHATVNHSIRYQLE